MPELLRLAITNVGDLLINQKITQDEEGNALENINLDIPNYQRPYKWKAKNVIQLIDDITKSKNDNKEKYRVGTLILHYDRARNTYNIVDGQQRTITFALLLLAHNPELLIPFLECSLADNPFNKSNIPKNYRTLKRRLANNVDHRESKEMLDYILNNCEFIVVITENISEAFQFFDSQNARGKKLYPHDLLKAFHLREMKAIEMQETEKIVKTWEDLDQPKLSKLFSDYLYRIKEWSKGNHAFNLDEHNIHLFKGITKTDNFPYAQFFKGAHAYADAVNNSGMTFVSGIRNLKPFQLDAPIIAGKPFFDYAKHYYDILEDIKNNDKYQGYFINDNMIVHTLNLNHNKNGVGNRIARLLFDTAILLYIDRFTPSEKPSREDLSMLNQFVIFSFVWAYSLRAQYKNLGWHSAQKYIMGNKERINSFNIYKCIIEADSPVEILSTLSDKLNPIPENKIVPNLYDLDQKDEQNNKVFKSYLSHFKEYNFIAAQNEK